MPRRILIGSLLLFLLILQVKAQVSTNNSDSVTISPGVKQLLEVEDRSRFVPAYEFFFTEAKNFPPAAYDTLLSNLSRLEDKGFRPIYDFKDIFLLLDRAKNEYNYTYESLDQLVRVIGQLGTRHDRRTFNQYLNQLNGLLDGMITSDRSASIFIRNADFEILFNQPPDFTEPLVFSSSQMNDSSSGQGEQIAQGPLEAPLGPMIDEYGVVVKINKADLFLANYMDTFAIRGTEGYYLLEEQVIKGQDGRLTWENRGIEPEERFARLSQYNFNTNTRRFQFDNVWFQDKNYINEPINGELNLELSLSSVTMANFPEFISYSANNRVKLLGTDDLEFFGGLHLKGRNVLADSKFGEKSTLIGYSDNVKKFKVTSKKFTFDDEKRIADAENARVVLYHDQDSIVNSAVHVVYNYETTTLKAEANVEEYLNSPFRSSFFDVEIVGDRVLWDLKSDSMDITIVSAKREIPMIVQSKDFFSKQGYQELAQIFGFHPLTLVMQLAPNVGDEIFIPAIADKYGYNERLIENTMVFLKTQGFIEFDEAIGRVVVLPKATHFYNAYLTQINPSGYDYDDLLIPSVIGNQPNATLRLKDGSLLIRGVDEFLISDSLDVVIVPQDGQVVLREGRDLQFSGEINAGNFNFIGLNALFKYDSFLIQLDQIDSIKLKVELEQGRRGFLNNQFVKTSGTLRINEFDNKSALRSKPQYPIFKSNKLAKVYFSKEDILNGVYDSTVYFDLPPFELDSLADADPTDYSFPGVFHSNGILPDFDAELKVMKDNGFGFSKDIPDSGYSLYGTNARLFSGVQLDKKGLTSTGNISYLNALIEPERSTFYFDSLIAENGIRATMSAMTYNGVEYPDLSVQEYAMKWQVKEDSMHFTNKNAEKPFYLYDQSATLHGKVSLSANGLYGAGSMQLATSSLSSDSIFFKERSFQSRHADFIMKGERSARPILASTDVNLNYDLTNKNVTIEPEVIGQAVLEFPYAQFKTSITEAFWDIDKKRITMTKPDSVDLKDSFFYSTNASLDSLVFNGNDGVYDIETNELTIKGIPFIAVADARIRPKGDSLVILENSIIDRLEDATIILDTVNGFHRMFDASVDIISRNDFRGRATYELVNALQDTFAIQFDEFQLVPPSEGLPAYTKAGGSVSAEQEIRVSSGFIFEGDVTMYAYKKALELNGAVKLDLKSLSERNIWIEYSSNNDIAEVVIPFDQALTKQGQPLNAGLHFDARGGIYMSFITDKRDYMDNDFFVPKGGDLYFEAEQNAFRIDDPKKKADPYENLAGSMFSFNEDDQEVTFEGKLNFFSGNDASNIQAAGKGRGYIDSAVYEITAMLALNFGLSPEGLGAMASDMKKIGESVGVPKALDDRSDLIYRVAEFIGDEATQTWNKSFGTVPVPLFSVSPELQRDLVITETNLKWSKQNKAFYSEGKIGLSNISNVELDQEVDGFIEIRKTTEGDIFTLLLELTDGTWYYFSYDGFTLATFSSNEAYNSLVNTFNLGKYKAGNFNPLLISQTEVIQWVTDFRKLYYGIDEPYRLLMAGDSQQRLKKKGTVEGDGF